MTDLSPRVLELAGAPFRRFAGADMLPLRGPIVYIWTRGSDVLYVGMSRRGIERPLNSRHERLHAMKLEDGLSLWRCETEAQAIKLEARLIAALKPQLNRMRQAKKAWPAKGIGLRGGTYTVEFQYAGRSYRKALGRGISLREAQERAGEYKRAVIATLAPRRLRAVGRADGKRAPEPPALPPGGSWLPAPTPETLAFRAEVQRRMENWLPLHDLKVGR